MSATIFERAENWVFNKALPFWNEVGVDRRYGGFVESLTLDGKNSEVDFKRTRVTCRQIYVFSHAAILGWSDGRGNIGHGLDYLIEKSWMGEGEGFARTLSRNGDVLDPTQDLYDHAFCIFAFAWAYRATNDSELIIWANRTLDHIEQLLNHISGLGYWHDSNRKGWRLQNPHMHLLEASLVAYEAMGEERFKGLALRLGSLFSEHLYDRERGVLQEFFTDNWGLATGEPGAVIEPGHQFEWVWLLQNCNQLLSQDYAVEMRALFAFAEKFGVDRKTGATYNAVNNQGSILDKGSRTWPNTERIKAAAALYELDGFDPTKIFMQSAGLLLDTHLNCRPEGAWIDSFDSDGKEVSDLVPASTLYHVFLAFAEMMRIGHLRGEYNGRGAGQT